ncbi:hypothetical protein CGLO_12802 [Colletotrichum gloeosporioides Cg-14]|uniref:Uncharacterized protein n=1 Tax=Colletotrichum gloeosporioides (strain Cg-14) TaxID=1237896 RepID=T0LIP5_COLGC|nr:hypothetical protein CGLO_12802 [Colletotrichum gloeosporioides Cg-14]
MDRGLWDSFKDWEYEAALGSLLLQLVDLRGVPIHGAGSWC